MNAMLRRLLVLLPLVTMAPALPACGGDKGPEAKSPESEVKLDDAIALLPADAIALATVDARAFFGNEAFGSDLSKVVEKYMPIGDEAGFKASRDVDRITLANYSYQGIDVAAVLIGRFDEAKIKQMVAAKTPTKGGITLIASTYSGHDVYMAGDVGFTLLSSTRAIAGTESGIRRVLERIADKRVRRDITPWMIETIETPSAVAAVAGDFATHPAPAEILRQIPAPFVQNLQKVRLIAAFKAPGVQVVGSLSYPDDAAAQTASKSVTQVLGLSKWLSIFGIKIQSTDVKVEKNDVQIQLATDDASLRQILLQIPQWVGP